MKIIPFHRENNPYQKAVIRGLESVNNENGPLEKWEYVGFYALNDADELVGGVQGFFEWDWMFIKHLWVKDSRKGLGRKLMEQAEAYAKERGKVGILLDTFAFQARPFYEKIGFKTIATIEKAAGPHARYFMTKNLR